MISIKGLSVCRGLEGDRYSVTLPVLDVAPGETLAVTGMSGCGKSTLLEMIGLVLRPDQVESYEFLAHNTQYDVARYQQQNDSNALASIRAKHIGFMLQTGGLLPFLSVEDNLSLPRKINGSSPESDLVKELVVILNVSSLLKRKPKELSVGQRQRVAFVKALSHEPTLLLADEPTAALDPQHGAQLFETILEVVQRYQVAALIVTHNIDLVQSFGIRTISGKSCNTAGHTGSIFV